MNKNQNILQESKHTLYLYTYNLDDYATSKLDPPTSGFKEIDPKEFELNKCTSNNSNGCVLEVDLKCPRELRELHNDCHLAPDKIKI